jgi:hypothetical protein
VPGWGASAVEAAANAGFLSSRVPRGADCSSLPTHHEGGGEDSRASSNAGKGSEAVTLAGGGLLAAAEEGPSASSAAAGQVKRQRQQWQIPAQQQGPLHQGVPANAAAADDGYPAQAVAAADAALSELDPKELLRAQQQQLAVEHRDADVQRGNTQPWWETPFDSSSCRSPSPEATTSQQQQQQPRDHSPVHGQQQSSVHAAANSAAHTPPSQREKQRPAALMVHAHAEGLGAPISIHHGGGGSTSSSTASLSRAPSCDNSFTARGDGGPCGSVTSRSGNARRPSRTLSNLLLGRAGSRAALPCELAGGSASSSGSIAAAAAAGGSAGNAAAIYPASLAKIRMAFGPASPERVPRAGGFGGASGSVLAAAGTGVAAGGVLALTAGTAAACSSTAAAAAAGCEIAGGTAGAAGAAGAVIPMVAAAGVAGSAGVVAAVASRFAGKGSKSSKQHPGQPHSAPASPASAADHSGSVHSVSTGVEKPSRWRALFGSPSRRRPSPQHSVGEKSSARRHSSVLDAAGIHAASCSAAEGPASCSSSPAGYKRQVSAPSTSGEGASMGLLGQQGLRHPSPAMQGLAGAAPGEEATSGDLHHPPLTPGSPATAAAHAANLAAAEAARASGTCSPLKAHARNLSLPSKLMVLGSADPSPSASPNPVAPCSSGSSSPAHGSRQPQQQDAAAAATRSCSPSRLGPNAAGGLGSRHSSAGGSAAAPGPPAEASAASGSSVAATSHSQLLAEAVQLEALARSLSQTGRHAEAEAALRSSLAMISKQLGSSHPNTVAATTRLALHLNRNGKHTEAEKLLRQVRSTQVRSSRFCRLPPCHAGMRLQHQTIFEGNKRQHGRPVS